VRGPWLPTPSTSVSFDGGGSGRAGSAGAVVAVVVGTVVEVVDVEAVVVVVGAVDVVLGAVVEVVSALDRVDAGPSLCTDDEPVEQAAAVVSATVNHVADARAIHCVDCRPACCMSMDSSVLREQSSDAPHAQGVPSVDTARLPRRSSLDAG
jgi:hypothetical protein